jgi:hypothetical protein
MKAAREYRQELATRKFNEMVDVYEDALLTGVDQAGLFNAARDRLTDNGWPERAAANLVRCVLAVIASRHGTKLYTRDELSEICRLAAGRK